MIKVKLSYEHDEEYKDIQRIIAYLHGMGYWTKVKRPKKADKYKKVYIELT